MPGRNRSGWTSFTLYEIKYTKKNHNVNSKMKKI